MIALVGLARIAIWTSLLALYAIPPGREPVVSTMLGGDDALPGGCHWEGASIEHTYVVASYRCAGAPVRLELHHPLDAVSPLATTTQFAITTGDSAHVPPGLVEAIAARVRSHEAAWHWLDVRPGASSGGSTGGQTGTVYRSAPIIAAVVLAVAAAAWWLARRLASRRKPPA